MINEILASPLRTEPVTVPANYKPAHEENCPNCKGSGRFRSWAGRDVGACHKCKGTGKLIFATSYADRFKNRTNAASRKAARGAEALKAFAAEFAAEFAWLDGNDFGFAVAMREAIVKFGSLTENQLAAVRKCILKREEARTAASERKAAAPTVAAASVDALTSAFDNAVKTGKRAKLIFDGFSIKPAPANSANAGALYVRGADGTYLGKIADGRFQARRECTAKQTAAILAVATDPHGAAVAYGRATRSCSVCGIELTNPESIEAGIGPICATKMGW